MNNLVYDYLTLSNIENESIKVKKFNIKIEKVFNSLTNNSFIIKVKTKENKLIHEYMIFDTNVIKRKFFFDSNYFVNDEYFKYDSLVRLINFIVNDG